jgi:predicted RNA binding protein YcfA (HicA-like mRNA interferase family)
MMLPAVAGRHALEAFGKSGSTVDRVQGNHHIMKKPGHHWHLSIPIHGNAAMPPGTLRRLVRDAGVTIESFVEQL